MANADVKARSHFPQASGQHYTTSLNLEPRGGKEKMTAAEKHRGAEVFWKHASKKMDTAGDSWRDWLRIGLPGGIMLAAYVLGGPTKTLIG